MNVRLFATLSRAAFLVFPAIAQETKPDLAGAPAAAESMPMDCKMMEQGGMPMGKDMATGRDMPNAH